MPANIWLNVHLKEGAGAARLVTEALIASVLKPCGRALFWSARPAPAFAQRLARADFKVQVVPAPLYARAKRCAVSIYVAEKQ